MRDHPGQSPRSTTLGFDPPPTATDATVTEYFAHDARAWLDRHVNLETGVGVPASSRRRDRTDAGTHRRVARVPRVAAARVSRRAPHRHERQDVDRAHGDASCSARSASRSVRTRARTSNGSTSASRTRASRSPTTSSTSSLRTVAVVGGRTRPPSVVLRGADRGGVLVVRGPRGRRRRRRGRTRRHVGRDQLARDPRGGDHERRDRPR